MEANYDFSVYRKQGYSDDQIFGAMLEKEPLLKVYADQGYTPSQILGAMEPAQHAPPLATDTGDTMRGATEAVKQLPQLMYGAAAGIGAIGESIFGEGGLSSDLKAYGVKKYQEIGADIAKDTKVTDSLTYSWDQFQQGNYGAMVDWMQHGFGYGGVQMLEVLASAGVGAVAGKALLKGTVEQVASRMVAKEAAKITVAETAAISAGELTTKAITKQAVANTAAKIGQLVGVGMQAYGMEAGEIGGGLAEQSVKSGKPLTGAEIAKGLGAIAAAGSLEFVGDKIGLDLILGKSKLFSPAKGAVGLGGKVARAALGTVAAVPAEAGTEYLQTGLEEYGQGHEANILPFNQSPEAQKQAFDAAGLGGLGGGQQAVVGGILSAPTVNDAISTFNASTNASTDLIDSVLAQPAGFSPPASGTTAPPIQTPSVAAQELTRPLQAQQASPPSTQLIQEAQNVQAQQILPANQNGLPLQGQEVVARPEVAGKPATVSGADTEAVRQYDTPAVSNDEAIARLRGDATNIFLGDVSNHERANQTKLIDSGIVNAVKAGIPEEQIYNALYAKGVTSENLVKLLPVSQQQPATPIPNATGEAASAMPGTIKQLSDGNYVKGQGRFPAKTNKIQLERALRISTIPEGTILATGDKPFTKRGKASLRLKTDKALKKTHRIIQIEGGYGIAPKVIAPEIQTAQETAKKFVLPSKMQSMTDDRMANETHRANLDQMNSEFGWAERGGKLIRNMEGDATARTKWVPLDDRLLWQGRPDQNVSEAEARDFVRKALKSEPLQAKGHRFVNYLLDVLVEREKQIISLENEVEKAENNLTDAENQALDALMIEVETLIGKDEISKIFDRHADYTQTDGVRAWYDALTFAYQNAAEFAMRATHDKAQAGNKERMALMMAEISAEIGTNARSQHERTGKTKQADTGIAKEGNQAGSAENGTGTNALTLKTQTQAEITAQEQAQADHEAAQKSEEVAARAEQAARDQAAVDAKIKARTENPENFQFGESSKQAAAPVGDLFTQPEALSAIKKSDIPPADQIKLAADLRKGNVSPEDVQAVLGEAKPVEAQATIRGEEMKVGDDVHWMSGGTWDGVIQSIKPLPSGNHTLTIKASNGETITLDAAEHYGIALGRSEFYPNLPKAEPKTPPPPAISEKAGNLKQARFEDQDQRFHYSTGNMGMTSSGAFTADKSRWITFTREEALSMDSRNVKPAYATKRGIFTGTVSGNKLIQPPKPVTPQVDIQQEQAQYEANGEQYEIPSKTTRDLPVVGADLTALRREVAGIEKPEKGITLQVTDDGKAIATGPKGIKVPDNFRQFATDHNLTLVVQRRKAFNGQESTTYSDGQIGYTAAASSTAEKPMPIEYRESGALYFGEMGNDHIQSNDGLRFSTAPGNKPTLDLDHQVHLLQDKYDITRDEARQMYEAGDRIDAKGNKYTRGMYSEGEPAANPHTVESLKIALLESNTGKDREALQAMLDAGKAKVITADEANGIVGDKFFSLIKPINLKLTQEQILAANKSASKAIEQPNGPYNKSLAKQISKENMDDVIAIWREARKRHTAREKSKISYDEMEFRKKIRQGLLDTGFSGRVLEKIKGGTSLYNAYFSARYDIENATKIAKIKKIYDKATNAPTYDLWPEKIKAELKEEAATLSIYGSVNYSDLDDIGMVGTLYAVSKEAQNRGAVLEYLSATDEQSGGSHYLRLPNGLLLRLTDHDLPDTPQRLFNRADGLTGRWDDEIILNDWKTSSIDDYMSKIFGEENAASAISPSFNIPKSADENMVTPQGGMQERAVRADESGSPELAQNSAAGSEANNAPEIKYSQDGQAQAFYNPSDQTTYFIADALSKDTTPEEIRGLVRHEIAVHALNLGRDSKEFQSILKQVDILRKAGNKKVIEAFARVPEGTAPDDVIHESMAYLVQYHKELSVVKRFIAWFREQLRAIAKSFPIGKQLKFNKWANSLDENDLMYMAQTAMSRAYEASNVLIAGKEAGTFSVSEKPVEGMSKARVHQAILKLRSRWLGFRKINIVQSVKDLPAGVGGLQSATHTDVPLKEGEELFLRYGEPPESGISKHVQHGQEELGISVMIPLSELGNSSWSMQQIFSMTAGEMGRRDLYVIAGKRLTNDPDSYQYKYGKGKYVTGSDGEPILKTARIIRKATPMERYQLVHDMESVATNRHGFDPQPNIYSWLNSEKPLSEETVLETNKDVPQKFSTANAKTEAIYDPRTNSIYLIADNIATPERAVWVAIHETSHAGLRMIDRTVAESLDKLAKNSSVSKLATAIAQDRAWMYGKEGMPQAESVEEAFAELSSAIETDNLDALLNRYGVKMHPAFRSGLVGAVNRVIEAIRNFIAKVMGRPVAEVTDAEVRGLIAEARRVIEGKATASQFEPGGAVMASNAAQARFYSQLHRVINNAPDKIFGNGKQVAAWLQANAAKNQIKSDEIFWSGITDYLNGAGKVTKADVLNFLDGNGVQVEEVMLSNDAQVDWSAQRRYDGTWQVRANGTDVDTVIAKTEREAIDQVKNSPNIEDLMEDYPETRPAGMPKHGGGNLVLPGGENYREIVLTAPQAKKWGEGDTTHFGDTGEGKTIAWLRVNDRTSADGDAVLFIEEEQSKRGQAGRKEGFVGKEYADFMHDIASNYELPKDTGRWSATLLKNSGVPESSVNRWYELNMQKSAIPPAPFVSDSNNKATSAHLALALKHAIIDAVERGKTVVAWTTAQQQADRYSLDKYVDEVYAAPNPLKEGSFLVIGRKDKNELFRKDDVSADKLEDIVGKDLAEKIQSQKADHVYRGIELKVNPKWTLDMYGGENGLDASGKPSLMTQAANSIFKQLKIEGKVESVSLEQRTKATEGIRIKQYAGEDGWYAYRMNNGMQEILGDYASKEDAKQDLRGGMRQPSFRITPELRAKVMNEGMPLFSTAPKPKTAADLLRAPNKRGMEADTGLRQAQSDISKLNKQPAKEHGSTGNTLSGIINKIPSAPLVSKDIHGERFTLPGESQAQRFQRKAQNAQNRWEVIQGAVIEQGGTVTEATNVAEHMVRFPGKVAAAMLDFGNNTLEHVMKRIAATKTTLDDVSLLAYAEHATERNSEMAKINPLFPNDGTRGKSGSGMTDRDAKDIIAHYKTQPNSSEMFALTAELRAIANERLDNLVASGAMAQAQADAYRAKYKSYVPLKGYELIDEAGVPQGTGKGFSTGKKIDMRALGRSSRAGQIAQNVFRDFEAGIILAEKARLGKVVAAFIEDNPDKALWTVGEAPKKPSYTKGGSVHQVLYFGSVVGEFAHPTDAHAFADELRGKADVEKSDVKVESHRINPEGVVTQRETAFDPEAEIRFIKNGKEMRIQITDPLMVRGYNNLWHPGVAGALTLLNTYNGWLRQMYTQKNPAWFAMNIFKDIPSAAIYTAGEGGVAMGAKVIANIPKSLRAAWNYHHNKPAGVEMDKIIKLYLANGGYTGFAYVGDIEAQTLKLEGLIHRYTSWGETGEKFKAGEYKKGLRDIGVKLMNTRFMAWIEALNTTFENTTRLAVFKAAIDSGMTPSQAGVLAKTASTNFNRRGEWGPNMNAVWLFSNAGIQGTRNVGHALFFSPHKEQVWALMSGMVALGIMAGLMGDDDDDLIDDAERAKSIVFKFGESKIAIPMPYGFGFFSGFGQYFAQTMKHPDKREKIAVMMADLSMSHFSPFGNPYAGGQAKIKGLANLTPTIGRPFANTMVNISPFGGMMYPENPFGKTPDSEKSWRNTKGTSYDMTAKWLNSITGGDVAREGLVSVSPETLKLGVSTLFGGAGKLVTDSFSLLVDVPNDNVKAKNVPIMKNFYQAIDTDAYMRRFYDDSKEAADAYKIFRTYVKAGDLDAAKEYKLEERVMVTMGKTVAAYNKKLSQLREAEDEIKASDLPKELKKQRLGKIDEKRRRIAELFNERLKVNYGR